MIDARKDNLNRILLLGIILISWALLTWQLGQRSLWVDEFLSLSMSQGALSDVVAASMADLHPPLYFLALHVWAALIGTSDFALRYLSVAFAVVGLALMPIVARRWAGSRTAVPATVLLGLAPAFIEISRMARYYSLLLMLGLLSTRLLFDALARSDWKRWIAYVLSGLALLYTFYPSGILILAHVLMIVWPARKRIAIRRWLIAIGAIGAGFAPWLAAIAARQITNIASSPGADLARSGIGFVLGVATSLYTFSVGETIFPWQPAAWVGVLTVVVLLIAGLRQRSGGWPSAGMFLIGIAFISLVTTFVSVSTPFLNVPVRGLFVLPFYLLIVAIGLASIAARRIRIGLTGVLLIVWGIGTANNFAGQQSLNPIYLTPSKEAAAFVRHAAASTDLVISDYDSIFGFYFLPGGSTPPHLYTSQVDDIRTALDATQPPRVWLITIGRDQTQRDSTVGLVRGALSKAYRLAQTFDYLPIDPTYLRVKEWLLRRESYTHRLTVELYEQESR